MQLGTQDHIDVIVIGAGVIGSSTAYQLAKDGRKVLLLEKYEIAHARASSHGESRIFRFAYDNLAYARLAMQTLPMWRELEQEAGEQLLVSSGGLDLTDEEAKHPEVYAVAGTLAQVGAPFDFLDAAAMRARFPQWHLGDAAAAVYSPDAGILNATRCVATLVAQAAKHGAIVRDSEPVTEIRAEPSGVQVTTTQSRYQARQLVITGGAWANSLLAQVGMHLPLTVTQEQVTYFKPLRNAALFERGPFPIFIHWSSGDTGYGFPIVGKPGIKVGFHHDHYVIDPEQYDCQPRPGVAARHSNYVQRYLPDAAGESFDPTTCLYTSTPDNDFIVDFAPGLPNVVVSASCSGHGFKFGPGLGRAMADLLAHGATDMNIGHVRLREF